MSAHFDTFTITRIFQARPNEVYAAFASLEKRAAWFKGPAGWVQSNRELDFRVGGHEVMEGAFGNGVSTGYTAHFYDLVSNERIVNSFEVSINGRVFSVSLTTTQLEEAEGGTKLTLTEQIVYLDNAAGEQARLSRVNGTSVGYDLLERYLGGDPNPRPATMGEFECGKANFVD